MVAAGTPRGAKPAGDEAEGDGQLDLLSIGQVAVAAGVSTRTIRYYEELGILPEPPRTAAGTRKYPRDWLFHIESARALKELGFSLEEIRILRRLALGQVLTGVNREEAVEVVHAKLKTLERKIRVLSRLHSILETIEQGDDTPVRLNDIARIFSSTSDGS